MSKLCPQKRLESVISGWKAVGVGWNPQYLCEVSRNGGARICPPEAEVAGSNPVGRIEKAPERSSGAFSIGPVRRCTFGSSRGAEEVFANAIRAYTAETSEDREATAAQSCRGYLTPPPGHTPQVLVYQG